MISSFALKLLHRINSNLLWDIYRYKSNKIFNQSYLILSFDCDTEEDIACIEEIHIKLEELGVTPVYAVPGELLKKGDKVYKKIFQKGAEFINHGGCSHTYFDKKNNRYASCFFYDKQSLERLKQDIYEGHYALKEVLGCAVRGWRTPHFGTFQSKQQLEFLYDVLNELNYTYSTSTVPFKAYKHGPLYRRKKILEIPVTGIYDEPFNIMDTWAYFASPERVKEKEEYIAGAKKLAILAKNNSVLINIYGDPSHIYREPYFFEAIKILRLHTKNVSYSQMVEEINESCGVF